MNRKSLDRVEVKAGDAGEVTAVFATLNVVDSDGDVTLPGAFTDGAEVRISAYGHTSWAGALPVGKGSIAVEGDEAILHGQFFLDTVGGRETFSVVKQLGPMQEWSYGYDVIDSDRAERDGRDVRLLKSLKVYEVSPVLLGAGVGTRTLAAKSGLKFAEHAESVLADVDALVARAAEVVALRAEKGKGISDMSADLLGRLTGSLKRLEELVSTPATDTTADDVAREFARYIALTTQGA